MRLLSEEARQKTDQLLLTCPVSITGIVLGKYLAALALFAAALAVTGVFPALIDTAGTGDPLGDLLHLPRRVPPRGLAHLGRASCVSSLTDNPVSAAFLTFGAILFIWVLDWLIQALPRDRVAGVVFARRC